jgi:hypothetical protein
MLLTENKIIRYKLFRETFLNKVINNTKTTKFEKETAHNLLLKKNIFYELNIKDLYSKINNDYFDD